MCWILPRSSWMVNGQSKPLDDCYQPVPNCSECWADDHLSHSNVKYIKAMSTDRLDLAGISFSWLLFSGKFKIHILVQKKIAFFNNMGEGKTIQITREVQRKSYIIKGRPLLYIKWKQNRNLTFKYILKTMWLKKSYLYRNVTALVKIIGWKILPDNHFN